ncbi:MAG TPA: flagellin [Candidatus Ozemobacteraceae bacterium]|nr:flagellin [Candidatus Ozemobacteraceae bacterium]
MSSLRINQNISSIKAHTTLAGTSDRLEKSIEKLSSGLRINRAADDAAGLTISEKLRRQIRGLSRASLNAQDGISMIQTAEGALNESHAILQRMRELAIQSANDTLTSNDRLEIQKEVNQLRDDLNRIARNTEFNTKKLLDGSQTALISASTMAVKGLVTGLGSGSGDYEVSIALIHGGISQMQRSQIFTIAGTDSTLAVGSTQMQSIAQFYDANGVFALGVPQKLTISGNSREAELVIDGQMTLDQLSAAIQNAMIGTSGLNLSGSTASLVTTAQTGLPGLGGYIRVVSGSLGEEGNVTFSADQPLLCGLGMSVVRDSKNNLTELTCRDAFGNQTQMRTDSTRASGLLAGIDLEFSSQAAQVAGLGGLEMGLTVSPDVSFTVSAGGVEFSVTVAQGVWTMEGLARSIEEQLTGTAVGYGNMSGIKTAVVDGEVRILFEPVAAGSSSQIVIAGASASGSIGLLNGSYSGFVQATKDVSKEVYGFGRYADVAAYTVSFSVSDGIGVVTAWFETVSAVTVADMQKFEEWQALMNDAMLAATVMVRVDAANGGLAFTSLHVGRETTETGTRESRVSVVMNSADFRNRFGMTDATANGVGDRNFRLHVVDKTSQFQIGADQGQIMQISIGNMTAEALGVDNLDMTSIAGSEKALSRLNKALDTVSSERSKLGAFQNRLEYAISNIRNTHSNLSAAESRLRDADMAQEMIEFTRNQIVSQSGMAMLAQSNAIPQGVLQLLK